MAKTIKKLFEDNKSFINRGGIILYEELDDYAFEVGNWCVCKSYSDFEEYIEKCLDEIKEKLSTIKVKFNEDYSFEYTYEKNKKDLFKFRFRKVDKDLDAWEVAESDGFPAYLD